MDPNANLREQRELIVCIRDSGYDKFKTHNMQDDALRLAELVEALDEWLSKDGAMPDAWKVGR